MSHRKRSEKSAEGADSHIGYGDMTGFSRRLSEHLKERKLGITRQEWAQKGQTHPPRKP